MTKFCEDCPMRGKAVNGLKAHSSDAIFGWHPLTLEVMYDGRAGVFIDESGGLSEPMLMPTDAAGIPELTGAIEQCQEPETRGRFFKKRICPAVGHLAINNPSARLYVLQQHASVPLGLDYSKE